MQLDQDLSYITERILAMSFPAEDFEAQFRNPMTEVPSAAMLWIRCQVQRFLRNKHPMHHRVYNLCKEKSRRCFIRLWMSNLSASYQLDAFYECCHRHSATFTAMANLGSPSMTTLSVP